MSSSSSTSTTICKGLDQPSPKYSPTTDSTVSRAGPSDQPSGPKAITIPTQMTSITLNSMINPMNSVNTQSVGLAKQSTDREDEYFPKTQSYLNNQLKEDWRRMLEKTKHQLAHGHKQDKQEEEASKNGFEGIKAEESDH